MPKIKVKVTIKNSETKDILETTAIIEENTIKYQEKDFTKVTFNYKENKLIRENDQMKMIYYFDNTKESTILIKEYDRRISLSLKTDKLTKKDNNLEIEYRIDNEKFEYRIEELK